MTRMSAPTTTIGSKKPKRLPAGQVQGIGNARYRLIRSAAERISKAMDWGYDLEAVALIESILAERLEKRAQWLYKQPGGQAKALEHVKDGFATLGDLTNGLLKVETDAALRKAIEAVNSWRTGRNTTIHAMVKLGDSHRDLWDERLKHARKVAEKGIEVLLALDLEERRVCHAARKRTHASATCPKALEPIGQRECEWCREYRD